MVDSCSSFGCTNVRQSGSNIQFHQFPLNRPDVLKKWIHAMGSKTFIPNEYSYLCSEHFNPDDYQIQPGSNEKLLLINAVPSIFKSFPEHFQNQEIGENSKNDIYVHNTNNSILPKQVETKTYDYQNLTASSIVTCGNCKKQMNFKEYDTKHRSVHYNLCWLDGIQDKIDFFSTPQLKTLSRKMYNNKNRSGRQLKCEWCNKIKRTVSGLFNHLKTCKYNVTEYSNYNKSVKSNIANLRKQLMHNKIKILQRNLKQRDAKIRLLKGN
ncbi:Hypothetical protein CINCED_3A012609 [Cinara cedri]|uniref:THAP-type domain-containing protein n=1 Tax=Cinara cedri TaxID=506608 RepID=A0A5E4MKG8_9HEMI|nr:Hypothetical protein CINCED_3A012609 [Cinara cedri]